MASSARKTGVWIVVGLLCLGMISFGSSGFGTSIRSIGQVGDRDVSVQTYANALNDELARLGQQFGTPISLEQARAFGLDQMVLGQVAGDAALSGMADGMGLSVGDAAVARDLRSNQAFQGLSGDFDRDTYRLRLEQRGLTEPQYEGQVRDELTRRLLQIAVAGGLTAPPGLTEAIVGYNRETRDLTWARVTPDLLTDTLPEPTEADLQAFYDANPDLFTAPEVRNITYAWLTPEMIQGTVTVDDQAVQDLYQERIAEFVQPERRLTERLVFIDEAAATAAKARLDAGELTFDALVAERGLDLSDIDLGDVALAELEGAGGAVFAAQPGDVVGPLPSPLGPALFRMNAVLAADEVTFEEVAEDLRGELANQRARRIIGDNLEPVQDLLAGGATLEDLAERTDLELGTIAWTPDLTEGIAAYDAFRAAAASAVEGADPSPGMFDDGGMFLIRLDSVTPPALRPLAEVTEAVRAGWTNLSRQTALLVEAERRAELIRAAGGFDAPDLNLIPTVETGLLRSDVLPDAPADSVTRAFGMAEGDVAVIDAGTDGAIILQLNAIKPPDPADAAILAETVALQGDVTAGLAQDMFAAFNAAVLSGTTVDLDPVAVEAVLNSMQQ